MSQIRFDIVHVDDDDIDREAVRRALREHEIDCQLVPARDGLEALEILNENYTGPDSNPFIILLDINMPRMGGIEFLNLIRDDLQHSSVKNAIVFVLTTSNAEIDLKRAYERNISGYIIKSDYTEGLSKFADFLQAYDRVTVFP